MPQDRRPNILLIYTDQHRYDALGCSGNPLIRTPNIDRMAGEGVNISRGYVTTPICLPSRVGLFTGRYNHTNLSYTNDRFMSDREIDLPALLRANGYHTALIGKDHCFGATRIARIFDHAQLATHTELCAGDEETQRKVREARDGTMQLPFAEDPIPPEMNITGTLGRWTREYVAERAAADEPFFCWLSIPDPHPPYMVCEPYASMYDDVDVPLPAWTEGETDTKPFRQQKVVEWDRYGREYPGEDIRRLIRIYWGMVSCIDDEVGRILQTLDEQGIAEDTIVLFTADHGDYMGDHRMIRKGPHLYEALTHVPLICRWPGRFRARQTDAMATNIDIYPTLCELAGVEAPDVVQGESFAPLLRGETEVHRDRVFLEHGGPGAPLRPADVTEELEAELAEDTGHHLCPTIYRGRVKGVRTDRWKYCYTPGDVDELYDLQADPRELTNVAGDPSLAEIVADHRRMLLEWLIDSEDTTAP